MPLETIVASPSTSHTAPPRPRTWPTKSTPPQTRQQAKQKGVTVATITDLMKIGDRPIENLQGTTEANINRPRTRLRSRENATSIPPAPVVIKIKDEFLEDGDISSQATSPLGHAGRGQKRKRKVDQKSDEPDETKSKVTNSQPKPRRLQKGTGAKRSADTDTFDLKDRKKARK